MIEGIYEAILKIIIFLLALSVHESAHAYSAYRLGDPTAYYMGRVSLNPIRHMDPIGTILLPIMGIFTGFIIGWAKPCPVNLYNFRNPIRDNMIVAFSGPLSNILLAAIGSLFFSLLSNLFVLSNTMAYYFFANFVFINLLLAFFNLIPIPPLDGSHILEGLIPSNWYDTYQQIKPYGFLILIIFMFSGLLGLILSPLVRLIFKLFTFYWQ